ncbi:MAG: hypothetical protein DRN12_02200 [Thermoplasmata archaeon]|mgnify:CR=1 FL=1|nr:MAG: hypothetical protein DRN12_02200 [Thermoplasmata archaeon]
MKNMVFGVVTLFFLAGIPSIIDAEFLMENKEYNMEDTGEELATVYIKKFDAKLNKLVDKPIANISKSEALKLKETLQEIWEDKSLSAEEKTIKQLHILYDENILPSDIPIDELCRFIRDMSNRDVSTFPIASTQGNVMNFLSFIFMFNLFQSTSFAWLCLASENYYSPPVDVFGYNLSAFFQYAVCGIVAPYYALGYLSTVGLLGAQGFFQPTSYFGFIFGFAWIMFALQWGTPPASIFEIIFGLAGLPVFVEFV